MRIQIPATLAVALCLCAGARADIDPANFDTAVKPSDNFYEYVNGGWLKSHPIPAALTSWGAFQELHDRNEATLHAIAEKFAPDRPDRTFIQKLVGDFYASGMDEAAIQAAGISPLKGEFDRIAAISTVADVGAEIAHMHRMGIASGFFIASEQDPKASDRVIAGIGQGGLGLPDRDYYTRDDDRSKKLREQYVAHVTRMLTLAGYSAADADAGAQAVMSLETALAKASRTRAALRDPVANYNKTTLADLARETPHFAWTPYFADIGLGDLPFVDVGQPEFMTGFDSVLASAPVSAWRTYFAWHLIHECAPFLSPEFVNENFEFYGKTMTGTKVLRDRWKRVVSAVDLNVGEALGQLYVADNFPPEAKARMLRLVGNLRSTLRARISTLEWMDEPTRAKALVKLDALNVKIGYPDKWIDYSTLSVDRGVYVSNVLRARAFGVHRDLAKVGKPVDRAEWGMTPPTVNAYYDPSMNEIVFPAGILQPPFFDDKADDAVNYGGIGAVIGHEMTHGFDDQGRQFDSHGNLDDWWSKESADRFKARAAGIVKQFDGYVAIDDLHVKGELTQGENIADLGGVRIAYAALESALGSGPRVKIGGFTPEQRFFISFATIWRTNQRPEAMRLQVNTDPHSPAMFRVNGPLSNLDVFAAAFDVPEGAPMRRPADQRVTIW